MKVIAHTPRGTFESVDEPIQPLDREAVRSHLVSDVNAAKTVSINTKDGFIVIPGALVAQSAFVVENFNTPVPEGKL